MLNGITLGIIIVIVIFVFLVIISLLTNLLLAPVIRTPKRVIQEILDIMNLTKRDTFVDFGCGDGRLVLSAYEQAKCKCIGYDISPIMLILAKTAKVVRYPLVKDILFDAQDIFQVDISNVSKIYCFLDEKSMNILNEKLSNFVKGGGEVYSYEYGLADLKNEKKVILSNGNTLYVYRGA